MLLFKNGFRRLLKDYTQFIIYILLITISIVFTSTFGIVSSNLVRTKDEVTNNFEKYDYSFRYTSSGYSANDTQTFSPWFAFNTKLELNDENIALPSLSFGDEGVLLDYQFKIIAKENEANKYNYESSIYKINDKDLGTNSNLAVNFQFGDVESHLADTEYHRSYAPNDEQSIIKMNQQQKIEIVKSKKFGSFYKFNQDNIYFKNSLIGRLYENNQNFEGELTQNQINIALAIFDYMFYLNNSSLTDIIRQLILTKYDQLIAKGKTIVECEEALTNYINTDLMQDFSSKANPVSDPDQLLVKNRSYLIKNFESYETFRTKTDKFGYRLEGNNLTNRNWFNTYFELVGYMAKFKTNLTSEVVMWNSSGEKYRYISSFYNVLNGSDFESRFYNQDQLTIYEQYKGDNVFTTNSFMVSNGYAKNKNMKLGEEYEIFPITGGSTPLRMDAIATDSYNVYPTIYEEDLLTNQKNEAIFYISNVRFAEYFNYQDSLEKKVSDDNYQDVSRVYLTHKGNLADIEKDKHIFELFVADKFIDLSTVANLLNSGEDITNEFKKTNLTMQSYDETSVLNLRSSLLPMIAIGFMSIAIIFVLIFIIAISFLIYTIVRKIMVNQRSQIGCLKSLGYSNFKILSNYILYLTLPVILLAPIGWSVSLFLQVPIMNIFETYFNIPTIFSIDWNLLLIEWAAFSALIALVVCLVSYLTIRQSPVKLLSPSKSSTPNLFLARLSSNWHFKNFITKLRLNIISVSIKDLITFWFVTLCATAVLTSAALLPGTIQNMSKEYFANLKYENQYSYTGVSSNNPLDRYSFYDVNSSIEEANLDYSTFSNYVKGEDNNYYSLVKNTSTEMSQQDLHYQAIFEDMLVNNLLTFKNGFLSVGILDKLVENAEGKDNIKDNINLFTCNVLPKMFGQQEVENVSDYQECVKEMSNNLLPSTVKTNWDNDQNSFKNFTFNFATIAVEKGDELFTQINSNIINKNLDFTINGLNLENQNHNINLINQNLLKSNEKDGQIPVTINKKLQLQGYKIGDVIEVNTNLNKLNIKGKSQDYEIKQSDWGYEDENQTIDNIFTIEPNKFIYQDGKEKQYWIDENNNPQEYFDITKIYLDLPQEFEIDQELLSKVNSEYQEYSNKDSNNSIRYYPFDIHRLDKDNESMKLSIADYIMNQDGQMPNNWLNIALENGLLFNKVTPSKDKLKVVGIENLYDGNQVYMDQNHANKILGFDNSLIKNKENTNIWSNAKMSKNSAIVDQMERIILNSKNANNSLANIDKYMNTAIGKANYLAVTKTTLSELTQSVLSIAIVFISISFITAVIIIYLISDMLVGKYRQFMNSMRVLGYSMREINSIMMWIFAPISLLAIILGLGTVILSVFIIIPNILITLNIAVPLSLKYSLIPIISLIAFMIFIISYMMVFRSIKKTKLSQVLGN